MKKLILSVFVAVLAISAGYGQSVVGTWKTVDDETGKVKSYVQIYEKGGKIYGKITKLLNRGPNEDPDPVCTKCTDDRKGKKVIGLEIIRGLKKKGDEYKDGTILDPKNGENYDCKIWLDSQDKNKLNVRGYIAFFYRTQNWYRVK